MRAKIIALTAITAISVLFAPAAAAGAQPPPSLPNYFYGTVKIDSVDAPIGTTVEARVAGVLNDSSNPFTTTEVGKYGANPAVTPNRPGLVVQGSIIEGAIIEFFVGGVKANQTAPWRSGQATEVNLTAGSQPPPSIASPEVTSVGVTGITSAAATIHGRLVVIGEDKPATASFQWGTSQTYGNETSAQTLLAPVNFNTIINGLLPDTVYHFRAKTVVGQKTAFGADVAFRTNAPLITSLAVGTQAASGISTTTAVLNGNLSQLSGAVSATVSFQWGTTPAYGSETAGQVLSAAGAFSSTLSGLAPNTDYHFRAKAAAGQTTTFGPDLTFRTLVASGGRGGAVGGGGGTTGGGGGTTGGGGGGTGISTQSGKNVKLDGLTGSKPLAVDSSGKTLSDTRLSDSEQKVALILLSGTVMKGASGAAIDSITLSAPASIPAAPLRNAVVTARDFGPDGATFNPPIILALTYTQDDLPAGADEFALVIAFWDGAKWVSLPTAADTNTRTLTAFVSHFTLFGILSSPAGTVPAPITSSPAPQSPAAPPSSPAPAPAPPAPQDAPPQPAAASPQPTTPAAAPEVQPGAPPAQTNWALIIGVLVSAVIIALALIFFFRQKPANA